MYINKTKIRIKTNLFYAAFLLQVLKMGENIDQSSSHFLQYVMDNYFKNVLKWVIRKTEFKNTKNINPIFKLLDSVDIKPLCHIAIEVSKWFSISATGR